MAPGSDLAAMVSSSSSFQGVTDRSQIIERLQLGRQATMNAKELLVHDGGKGEVAERLHTGVVDLLGVLVLA